MGLESLWGQVQLPESRDTASFSAPKQPEELACDRWCYVPQFRLGSEAPSSEHASASCRWDPGAGHCLMMKRRKWREIEGL